MDTTAKEQKKTSPLLCKGQEIDLEAFWIQLKEKAQSVIAKEPMLKPLITEVILEAEDFEQALATRLSRKLAREDIPLDQIKPVLTEALKSEPGVLQSVTRDLVAIYDRDPACNHPFEPFLFYKGFHAITNYRISHILWNSDRTELAYYLQSIGNEVFQVDIHPAAKIGCGILLDHATSFVVGETAIIEDNVSILHEVTLGGTGKQSGLRHPIVRSGVLLGAGAKILGRVEIGMNAKVGAGSVVLTDVSSNVTVAGVPAELVGKSKHANPADEMDQCFVIGDFPRTSLDSAGL